MAYFTYEEPASGILGTRILAPAILIWLVLGHFALKGYMGGPLSLGAAVAIILLLAVRMMYGSRDAFLSVLAIYFCSHFLYAESQGGLWNFMALAVGLSYLVFLRPKTASSEGGTFVNILLAIIIFQNLVGWLLYNPMPSVKIAEGALSFLGYVIIFIICRDLELTAEKVRLFILVAVVLGVWMFLTSINQWVGLVRINTPLLGLFDPDQEGGENYRYFGQHRTMSILGHFELFGEYSMLMVALLIPVISSRYCRRTLGVSPYLLTATILIFTLCMIMSETRSSILLLCFAIIGYLILFSLVQVNTIDSRKSLVGVLIVGALILVALWDVIGGEYLWNRLTGLNFDQFAVSDLTSGEKINRLGPYLAGVDRLSQRNWIFGLGSGIPESNQMAWFGSQRSVYADYHSLYLSLPMLYGWAGAGAFIALIVFTAGRCLWAVRRYRKEIHFLTPVCLGLTVFWALFLVNEYKISILRMANYQMIVWIWLGFSHAVVNALERDAGTDMLDLS